MLLNMATRRIVLCAAVAAAVALANTACAKGQAKLPCGTIEHAEQVLRPGARLLFGESHGNAQTPKFVGDLACLAARQGGAVRLGLEIPVEEDARIRVFLASAGTVGERNALLNGPFWTDSFQDGRRSEAMLALLQSVREMRENGADVQVVPFDGPAADRDRAMADRLWAAFRREPKATFIVLSGNLHARKTTSGHKFMAAHLVEKGATITTLDARYGAGSSWICDMSRPPECGPVAFGEGEGKQQTITLKRSDDGAYDGFFELPAPVFSPPAAVPLTPQQQDRVYAMGRRIDGMAEYKARRFPQCAAVFVELAERTHAKDDAYSAACCFAVSGNADRAFEALTHSIERGFSDADWMEKDLDLVSLKSDPRWRTLVERARHPR
jgi:hypothetical protein